MKYSTIADQLDHMLREDQRNKRRIGKAFFSKQPLSAPADSTHSKQLHRILDVIGEPRISLVGLPGVEAIAVLGMHGDTMLLRRVIQLFKDVSNDQPEDTDCTLIPGLVDLLAVHEHRRQTYGTIWFFDHNNWPVLYPIDDPQGIGARRAKAGLWPLSWPRSLAIPVTEQPWLLLPLSRLESRWPKQAEWEQFGPYFQSVSEQERPAA